MADNAANFIATSESKPSIFEVIAQDNLNATLHPALQKVANFLASINRRKLNWLAIYYDEVFVILNGLLQYYYLRKYKASFSEYFYGLQRASVNGDKINVLQRRLSLLFIIVLPYLRKKLESKAETYRIEEAEGQLRNNFEQKCKKLAINFHKSFEGLWIICHLVQYLRYMSDKSVYQYPTLAIIRLKLIYSAPEENTTGFWTALFRGQISFSELGSSFLQNGAQSILELSAFFVQFLQAWNAEKSNYSITALPSVPHPQGDNRATNYKGKCPLCLQNWKIPTVVPVSGYVFCFSCIVRYLRRHESCPVTKLPANPLDIIRLYDVE